MPLLEILRALNAACEYWNSNAMTGMGVATVVVDMGEEQ